MWQELLEWLQAPRTRQIKIPKEVIEAAAGPISEMNERLEALLELEALERFEEHHALPRVFFDELDEAMSAYDRFGLGHDPDHFDYLCPRIRYSREGGNPLNSASSATSGPPPSRG